MTSTALCRVRRTKYLFFYIEDGRFLDISALLGGTVSLTNVRQVYALSILTQEVVPIQLSMLDSLVCIPSEDWISVDDAVSDNGLTQVDLKFFADHGLIVTDADTPDLVEFRRRDETLASSQWNVFAALFHFFSRWNDVRVKRGPPPEDQLPEDIGYTRDEHREFVRKYGKPPAHFYEPERTLGAVDLPSGRKTGELYAILEKRKTTRSMDRSVPMRLGDLSTILYYTFGCHGILPFMDGVAAIKRTSPSGGGLHPTEVYPLVINVNGIQPGMYHYSVERHRLELLVELDEDTARSWANEFTAGQIYPSWAHVLFIMTSRFYRHQWKYRKHEKAYSVLLMDAAHLSQTLYLIATELGLGAFVTAAINSDALESRLGIHPYEQGAILVCGCGVPLEPDEIDPKFAPYEPQGND